MVARTIPPSPPVVLRRAGARPRWWAALGGALLLLATLAVAPTVQAAPAASAPAVTRVAPNLGPWSGGTPVTITGSGFTGATRVAVGGIAALGVTLVSDTRITARTPARPTTTPQVPQQVVVRVTTALGTSGEALGAVFTYREGAAPAVTGLDPRVGDWAGGTRVTVTGTGFTGATKVAVGGIAGVSVQVLDDTSLLVTTPPRPRTAAARAVVRVTTPFGASGDVPAAAFTYVDISGPPAVGDIVPAALVADGRLRGFSVFGAHLDNVATLRVDGVATPFSRITTYRETFLVAYAARDTPGSAVVQLIGRDGSRGQAGSVVFVAGPVVPSVEFVDPMRSASGFTVGGETVWIAGYDFGATLPEVRFGGVAATVLRGDSRYVYAVAPPHPAGAVDVTVTSAVGASVPTRHSRYTYVDPVAPTVRAVTPDTGPWGGWTRITVTGSGFTGATRVAVGGLSARSVRVYSDTLLTADTPARSPADGAVTVVRVSNPHGTSGEALGAIFTYLG